MSATPATAATGRFLDRAASAFRRRLAELVESTGLPHEDVIPMASTTPASFMGTTTAGTITADWDEENSTLHVRKVTT